MANQTDLKEVSTMNESKGMVKCTQSLATHVSENVTYKEENLIMNNYTMDPPEVFEALENTNKTTQPYLLNTGVATGFLCLNVTLIVLSIYFHRLIILMVKRDNRRNQENMFSAKNHLL